jgi:hypothetical protein
MRTYVTEEDKKRIKEEGMITYDGKGNGFVSPNYIHSMVAYETCKEQDDFMNDMIDKGYSREKIIERLNQCYG